MNPGLGTHLIFVVSAPSGAGKTSLVSQVVKQVSKLSYSTSHTTRPKRPNEIDGQHYYFVETQEFNRLKENDSFVEHAEVFGYQYATSQKELRRLLAQGDVILDIDWQGAEQVRRHFPKESCTIFILPPSLQTLRERLSQRRQDPAAVIDSRMAQARSEMTHYADFDYVIVNDSFEIALNELSAVIQAERVKRHRQEIRHQVLINQLLDRL